MENCFFIIVKPLLKGLHRTQNRVPVFVLGKSICLKNGHQARNLDRKSILRKNQQGRLNSSLLKNCENYSNRNGPCCNHFRIWTCWIQTNQLQNTEIQQLRINITYPSQGWQMKRGLKPQVKNPFWSILSDTFLIPIWYLSVTLGYRKVSDGLQMGYRW
jgi:hypothetical protein